MTENTAAAPFNWTREHLLAYMSQGKHSSISDPLILNAFRAIDRSLFVPEAHLDKTYQDSYIPLEYKEFLPSPIFIARQLQHFKPQFGGKYLHLGTGTGYTAALLAFIAGSQGKVYSLDRVQWMWERARERLRQHYPDLKNLELLFRDGEAGLVDKALYDGILFSFIPNRIDDLLLEQLTPYGRVVYPGGDHTLRVIEKDGVGGLIEEIIPDINTSLLGKGRSGLA